ncbi:MAG: hypothetical protein IIX97_01240 [Clostridia bacterium]|nr:hypothetical protein [Clostridia bacterium]
MDKKFVIVLVALVLSITCTVGVTLAWLVSTPDPVINTFTVGDVVIELDESDVDDSDKDNDTTDRDKANSYKLIPGATYVKDPIVHVKKTSELCWVFVKLDNGLLDIVDGLATASDSDPANSVYTIEAQILNNGWTKLEDGVYYKQSVDASAATGEYLDLPVFEGFTLKTDADVDAYKSAKITVTAYAIQDEGIDTAAKAWEALNN